MPNYNGRATFIYDGYASLHGTPDHLVPRLNPMCLLDASHGLSGTEVNMFGLAYELARRGWEVEILSKWTDERIGRFGEFDGMQGIVRFLDLLHLDSDHVQKKDVVVSYHDARPLGAWRHNVFKIAHHQSYGLSPQEDAHNFADLYWTPTERVSNYHRVKRGWEVITIPNAWDFGTFKEWKPVPGRLIYHTSMERGFHRLVEAFPLIKEKVPEAHIVAFGRGGPSSYERMSAMLEGLGSSTIHMHSSRNQVLEILASAACFAYPCDVPSPCEVWPMSVTDALATGVPVVLAPDDGIEVVFEEGACLTREVKKGKWLEEFVESTVKVLKNETEENGYYQFGTSWGQCGKEWAAPFTFKNQCDRFLEEIGKRI